MSAEKILDAWKKKLFKPVYWLEGEESYYIDKLVGYAEHNLLSEEEAGFNLTVFYGKDANWADVVNACRKYPMFAEFQVVLLKEAQQMKDLDKLTTYINQPLSSTLLVVAHKEKKVDGKTKFARLLKEKTELLTTKKLYDNQLPDWASGMIQAKGYSISRKALLLLIDHIGNDLSRLDNEIEKLLVNLANRKEINEDDIEKYVGISKEYNVLELQKAFGRKDMAGIIRIVQYFKGNPKAGPIQLLLPALYGFFSKMYLYFSSPSRDERSLAAVMGVNPFFVWDYMEAGKHYTYEEIERALLLLHEYNLKSVGVNDSGTDHASLMKELAVKIIYN